MRDVLTQLMKGNHGSVAPTVALSLFGLIAIGGLAFDYAHMAAMDTELQNAADQAALAAASQLDGKIGAQSRAISAAQTLVSNLTYFANDSGGTNVTVPTLSFYSFYDDSTHTAATGYADSHFVEVEVGARTANFALTPIAGALTSGAISAKAVAGLGAAICNIPPVMICNPNGAGTFDVNAYVGDGLRLVANTGGGWVPGNFGYLETNGLGTGANALKTALGWNNLPIDCIPAFSVTTKPGASTSVTGSLNTRFDIYDANACVNGGSCSPSVNSAKDVVRPGNVSNANSCKLQPSGWRPPTFPYSPTSATVPVSGAALTNITGMGHPRDMCHAISNAGSCANGQRGNGLWDRDAYFYVNYGWNHATWQSQLAGAAANLNNITRYEVYTWEIAHPAAGADPRSITGSATLKSYRVPICSTIDNQTPRSVTPPTPASPGPIADRRRLVAAVIDCTGQGGRFTAQPQTWVDLFLVEPSLDRGTLTKHNEIYTEIIGETTSAKDGPIRRDFPYLVE